MHSVLNNVDECSFIKDIIDGMYDWVRVIDREDNVVYANKSMHEGLKYDPAGMKCYHALGRSTPCENCISRKSVFYGYAHQKEEIIGDRIYSIMSSPLKNKNGEIVSVVEVLRDITDLKELNSRLNLQNKKFRSDLDMARKIQLSILPENVTNSHLDFAYTYKPCESLGGDFIDIFKIDDSHIGLYIADVQGHGVSSSMLTLFVKFSLDKKILSPSESLHKLYRDFNKNNFDTDMYVTVFYLIIDLSNRIITYSNAGHNVSPVLFGKESIFILRSPGIPVSNWMDTPEYSDMKVQAQKGDRIFLYTDGVMEIRDGNAEQFGEDRLLNTLLNSRGTLSEILTIISNEISNFSLDKCLSHICDDITMAMLEIK